MPRAFSRVVSLAIAFVIATAGAVVFAQDIFRRSTSMYGNVEYDGRLTFVRLRYSGGFRRDPGWAHDYPTADIHMMKILSELSITPARTDGSNVLALDDPELFHHPITYMSEPGFWVPSEEDTTNLRNYLLKGGFIIFDDFRTREGHWHNLEEQMRRVLPQHRFLQIDAKSPIFNSFFEITSLQYPDVVRRRDADLLGDFRGQRSDETGHGDRQRGRRPGRVLGIFVDRPLSGGPVERGLQVRDELFHLRIDALGD